MKQRTLLFFLAIGILASSFTKKRKLESKELKAPLIIANSITPNANFLQYRIKTVFNATTASFYGCNLYMHYSNNPAGPFTNGVLPSSCSSGTALYNTSIAVFLPGQTYYFFYSTGTGTSYPSGSASQIYSLYLP